MRTIRHCEQLFVCSSGQCTAYAMDTPVCSSISARAINKSHFKASLMILQDNDFQFVFTSVSSENRIRLEELFNYFKRFKMNHLNDTNL